MASIRGAETMSSDEIQFELQRGGKLVVYYYCVSLLVVTFRRSSPVYLLRSGDSGVAKGMPWILLTLAAGWWGIPWGPIYSVQSLMINFRGGKEVPPQAKPAIQAAKA
jgi:hypothetical protein